METFTSNTKISQHSVNLSWEEMFVIVHRQQEQYLHGNEIINVYGIPRGGVYVALIWKACLPSRIKIVSDPNIADIIVDDIIDSGATAKKYTDAYQKCVVPAVSREEHPGWVVFPWEAMQNEQGPEDNIKRILEFIGEDPNREGLLETPNRVIRSWNTLYGGYSQNVEDVLKVFEDDSSDEMVVLSNVEFYSTCEHHMLPFFGKAHIAYIPNKKVVGISKLARILEIYARRLQIQERMCKQITNALMEHLNPLGAACILQAQHFCMTSRGVQKQNSIMTTSSLEGIFRTEQQTRNEFMNLIR